MKNHTVHDAGSAAQKRDITLSQEQQIAIVTSRKSVKEVEGDGDGEDNTDRHETIHNRKNF